MTDLIDIQAQLLEIKKKKEKAFTEQDFEMAASLRDKEKQLLHIIQKDCTPEQSSKQTTFMKNCINFSDNIKQYSDDKKILEFLTKQESLNEVYEEIKDSSSACVVPLVFVVDPNSFELDLNIIVKHEKADGFGQYEYYLIPDFINKQTNLVSLFNSLTISTQANQDNILNSIGDQIKEIHFQTSSDYKPTLELTDNFIIFKLNSPVVEKKKVENQLTGISGEFYVAAELAKQNFQVALTLGNAKGIDLFATNQLTEQVFEVEVKTLRKKPNCFTLNVERLKKEKIFVFDYLNEKEISPDFYILKGEELLGDPKHFYGSSLNTTRQTVNHGPLQIHKGRWDKFD